MERQGIVKRFLNYGIVTLGVGLGLALSGCSATTEPTAEASATAEVPVAATATAVPETAAWVEYVRNRATTLANKSDGSLVLAAQGICEELSDGKMFEEAVYDITSKVLPAAQQNDQILLLGTGIARFCPEYQRVSTGDSNKDFLASIRESAPSLAHNPDDAIISQATSACPNASEGPAGGAKVVSVSRKAWGNVEGYRFAFLAVSQFCSSALGNIAVNK
jgi:hypothetical protein